MRSGVDWKERYDRELRELTQDPRGFEVFPEPIFEPGAHPENFIDHECAFAARHIHRAQPESILDVGSYRHFILGLSAHYPVTTLDVRPRKTTGGNEVLITCDAKETTLPEDSFDLVLSL